MIGYPFDSIVTFDEHGTPNYDRGVSSKPLKELISKLFSTGVMPNPSNNLQVMAGSEGMTVVVKPGFCVIEGGLKLEERDRTLVIGDAHGTLDRIDTVVMRWDGNDNVRACDLHVISGTPATNPVRPALTRVGSIYEIGLADILVPAIATSISQSWITDTRYDSERCGIVSSVSEWDTTTIYAQVQSDLAEFKDVEEADFIAWYNAIKDRINAITAQSLQNQIDTIVNSYVETFNGRKGAITLTSQDVTGALGYTPPQQDTTYSPATQSANGLMSSTDKTKLDGIEANANNYSLPVAANGTRGGVQTGYQQSGKNYPVQLSSEKMYVNVPWEDTKTSEGITRTATTHVPGTNVEASLVATNKVNTFNVAVADWTDTTDYGYSYKATIITSEYTADSVPVWQMMGTGAVTTLSEEAEASKVQQAYFTASNIVLYAAEVPSVALVLKVKGA